MWRRCRHAAASDRSAQGAAVTWSPGHQTLGDQVRLLSSARRVSSSFLLSFQEQPFGEADARALNSSGHTHRQSQESRLSHREPGFREKPICAPSEPSAECLKPQCWSPRNRGSPWLPLPCDSSILAVTVTSCSTASQSLNTTGKASRRQRQLTLTRKQPTWWNLPNQAENRVPHPQR